MWSYHLVSADNTEIDFTFTEGVTDPLMDLIKYCDVNRDIYRTYMVRYTGITEWSEDLPDLDDTSVHIAYHLDA
jgi:hypothetical protein